MTKQPRFEFFGKVPALVTETPPLASALQSFENSLFLVGLGRFPAALTACGTAVESTIRAVKDYPTNSPNDGLKTVIDFAYKRKPSLRNKKLNKFREARNDFMHQGFSPEDDERAVSLLFGVGYPFLSQCLWQFHKFSIRDSIIDEVWNQVEIAKNVLEKIENTSCNKTSAAKAVKHYILINLRNPKHDLWADIDINFIEENFIEREKIKRSIEDKWNFYTYVNCPIPSCASQECIIRLDEDEQNKISPSSLFCFDCRFRLYKDDFALMEYLIGGSLRGQRSKILREYGLDD